MFLLQQTNINLLRLYICLDGNHFESSLELVQYKNVLFFVSATRAQKFFASGHILCSVQCCYTTITQPVEDRPINLSHFVFSQTASYLIMLVLAKKNTICYIPTHCVLELLCLFVFSYFCFLKISAAPIGLQNINGIAKLLSLNCLIIIIIFFLNSLMPSQISTSRYTCFAGPSDRVF